MAVVRWAEGQQRSGSIGGSTYSRNRSGAYIRARTKPVNPNTTRQVTARNRLRGLSIDWQNTLTQTQRDDWQVYAANVPFSGALGDTIILTGLNMFVRTNAAVLQAGLTQINDAPNVFTLAKAEAALAGTATEAAQTIDVTYDATAAWANEDDAAQLIQIGQPVGGGINFFGGPYRFAVAILGNATTPPTSPETVTSPWVLGAGQRIWVRTRVLRADGRLSEFAETNFLVTA